MLTWKDVINFSVNGNPIPDQRVEKTESDLRGLLANIENLNLVEKDSSGWTLTGEGGDACDAYLNSMRNLEF